MDEYLGRLLWCQLGAAGWFPDRGGDVRELTARLDLPRHVSRWLDASMVMLADLGVVRYENGVVFGRPENPQSLWDEWERAKGKWFADASVRPRLVIAEAMLRVLPEVLNGQKLTTDVIFPGGSMDQVIAVYKGNPLADFFNAWTTDVVAAYVEERVQADPAVRLRLLEIGAGTGSTSVDVFAKLRPWQHAIEEYRYTDVSRAFLQHAETTYGPDVPYLQYSLLDIERHPGEQGFILGGYDLILAANVLHATRDVRSTMDHVKTLLADNGLLVLNEMAGINLLTHVAFGLLEGWWLHEDPELRIQGSPALESQTWQSVLEDAGFRSVFFPVLESHHLGGQVVVAESDGVFTATAGKTTESSPVSEMSDTTGVGAEDTADHILETLRAELAAALKMPAESVHGNAAFRDYGLDSILGIQYVQRVNEVLGIDLATTVLFEHNSLDNLAAHVVASGEVTLAAPPAAPVSTGTVPNEKPVLNRDTEPIAIIGLSGRFAKSSSAGQLWEHLAAGTDLVQDVTRWDLSQHADGMRGSFVDGFDEFDPLFFGISGLEAEFMDPQQRVFLEEAWTALEDAGYAGESLRGGRCGVYVGFTGGDYHSLYPDGMRSPQAMLGRAGSILPARIAYHLDLRGPAVSVDTACSSSLVAIHLACQSLRSGETDAALAGGVFLLSTPEFYASTGSAGMLSPAGRCATFDASADGFVPGEGVGVVMLKRLTDALADGDHIHGVIRGSGVNQDGASNGITAPSVRAQEDLEREVYERFGVDPAAIQMVEAHGTGTPLGDPIEFEALTRAFRAHTDRTGYCAIGTIKSNLGHTAAAAGVAGVLKVLLALRHQQIPPSLHFKEGNPHIDFAGSPFYVNTDLTPWTAAAGRPRTAAVSAFGFSGTNAHVVIEEAPAVSRLAGATPKPGYLVALSAASAEQLQEQARRLVTWCAGQTEVSDLSFTLLTGRRHLKHRLAVVVRDADELVGVLNAWLTTGRQAPNLSISDNALDVREQRTLKRHGEQCIQDCAGSLADEQYLERLTTVAELHTQGYRFDFTPLFEGTGARRISLPTYPFAGRRYWVTAEPQPVARTAEVLHPLVHRNTSDLRTNRFTSTFTGDEFFLADHVVSGHRMLPGVVSLEMARAAVELALGELGRAEHVLRLRDVAWPQPFTALDGVPVDLQVTLVEQNGAVAFTLHSGDNAVHCQGIAGLTESAAPRIDVAALRRSITTGRMEADECYAALRAHGIEHGPRLQGLDHMMIGDGQVLAELVRPQAAPTTGDYWLHPSLMDAALQTVAGLTLRANAGGPAGVPFAVDAVEVFRPCPERLWVWTRHGERGAQSFDLDLCAEDGTVCARIQGLILRASSTGSADGVFVVPSWEAISLGDTPAAPPADLVVVGADLVSAIDAITTRRVSHVMWSAPTGTLVDPEDQKDGVVGLFRLVKALLRNGYGDRELQLTVVTTQTQAVSPDDECDPSHASVHGFAGALVKEYPHWRLRLVDVPREHDWPVDDLRFVPPTETGHGMAYRSGSWFEQRWLPASVPDAVGGFRRGGVYVVVGGAGGIGVAWSEYVAKAYGAQAVWIGRRPLDAVIESEMDRVGAVGPRPVYVSADVTDLAALTGAYREIKSRFGVVHGVVHSALVLADRGVAAMDEGEFRAALDVKVAGSVHVTEVFRHEPLDFVLFFSSLNSFLRAAGQSNYAAGCTFQDAYASRLASELPCAVRVVHWGYWGSVGIVATAEQRERMRRLGLASIEPPEAMAAVEAIVSSPATHVAFLNTTGAIELDGRRLGPIPVTNGGPLPSAHTAIQTRLQAQHGKSVPPPELTLPNSAEGGADAVRELVAEVLGAAADEIDVDTPLEEYGWDRVRLNAFTERMASRLGTEADSSALLGADTLRELTQELGRTEDGFEDLLVSLVWQQVFGLGWFRTAEVVADIPPVRELPAHLRAWLDETLRLLDSHGYVRFDGTTCVAHKSGATGAWERWDAAKAGWLTDHGLRAQVVLIETVLRALPDVLSGRRPATEVLFPDSSMDLVQGLYQGNALADFFNEVLADAVVSYVEHRRAVDPAVRLRIAEVGAGTGGTSATVFRRLRPYQDAIAEYRYTDMSQAFLRHAERSYGPGNPYLAYGLLDVERSPAEQGYELGGYDLVIAANVVHATQRVHRSLRNVKALLRPNGLLLLNELTRNQVWIHLTFGLLEGWWLTADQGLRIPGSPVLTVAAWRKTLSQTGYHAVGFPLGEDRAIQHHVIVAESDGVIALELADQPRSRPTPIRPPKPVETNGLPDRGVDALRAVFADVLRLRVEDVEATTPFEALGIDSIVVVQLTARLRTDFSDISSTLLFEYQTVGELAEHLLATYPDEMAGLIGEPAQPRIDVPARTVVSHVTATATSAATAVIPSISPVAREEIAIIGLAGRYPGADSPDELWANLRAGRDSVTEVPADRWDYREFGASGTGARPRWGGFLRDVDRFDPQFFGISPREAEFLDPQERLFAECAYATLQDAGYTRAAAAAHGQVGVFVGVMYQEYQLHAAQEQTLGRIVGIPGNPSSVANRVSYFCDFHGPSVAVDTMCSSSLTAIHLACQSILRGESDLALAGGVNVTIHPNKYLILTQSGLVPSGGRCAAFGAGGDGFVPSEGVGAVLLKPLSRAIADGDHIYGVIKGSAVNHGGKTNGYTVPNPKAHADVVTRALDQAAIDPASISYVEAHGTGTALGDPIEIAGLARVLGDRASTVAVGSVKSNIGHAESAAGIAGLTKILLQLRHNELVPSLHADELNPHIDFAATPFRVQRELAPWVANGTPRRAGLSSFGAGGSNAHLIIEEYRAPASAPVAAPGLIVLSAKDDDRLRESAARLAAFLRTTQDVRLADLAYTLQVGREAMPERFAFHAKDIADVRDRLAAFADGQPDGTGLAGEPVLDDWVSGADVDWAARYAVTPPRISLPTYPFARERYWLPVGKPSVGTGVAATLHPLVHRNTSSLWGQRFETVLTGTEFFLADHVVAGEPVLPAVASLEMARAAVALGLDEDPAAPRPFRLTDVVWARPVRPGVPLSIELSVEGERIPFRINGPESVVHVEGDAWTKAPAEHAHVDLDAVRSATAEVSVDECYELLTSGGVHYGPSMRGLVAVRAGHGQVLARVRVPGGADPSGYVLHPSVLDAALHAGVALRLADAGSALPFAVAELDFLAECPSELWVWLRVRPEGGVFDVDLCDDDGRVCVRLTGLSVRPVEASSETVLLSQVWRSETPVAHRGDRVVLATGAIADVLGECVRLSGSFEQDVLTTLREVRRRSSSDTLFQLVVTPQDMLTGGLLGLLSAAEREHPGLRGQLVEVPASTGVADLLAQASGLAAHHVRATSAGLEVADWAEIPRTEAEIPWRPDGVYLVTGGQGGVGRLLAAEIRRQAPGATVILAGRSAATDVPAGAIYRQVDVTDIGAVHLLVNEVIAEHGKVDGVVHAAGVLGDQLLATQQDADVAAVLAPKVAGVRAIDEVTRDLPLDFFVLFSSLAGVFGNVGQSAYAAANGFLDRFAAQRATLVEQRLRHGRTVAINWPLWAEGGMTMPADAIAAAHEGAGLRPMPTDEGMQALYRALACGHSQVLVLHGDDVSVSRITAVPTALPPPVLVAGAPDRDRVARYLTKILSSVLKLPGHRVAPDVELANYGLDSITALEMIRDLERPFGPLSKTLLFEFRTVNALAEYFLAHHAERVAGAVGAVAVAPVARPTAKRFTAPVREDSQDVAIIGLAGKYPGARTLDEFWANLRSGVDSVSEIPAERWDFRATGGGRWGGFLDGVDRFDAGFFTITPREAELLDPQERLLLECAYATLQDAGYTRAGAAAHGQVGVYVGVMYEEYQLYAAAAQAVGQSLTLAGSPASIANRVSYFCDFHGPSVAVDTMCSSSLTAIHLACQSILRGESDLALAGGVNVSVHPNKYLMLDQGGFLAGNGRCASFGAGGDGYVPGEGVGAVLLKPLSRAIADGDHVYGVIKGSAVNHGGKTNGYTVPDPAAQRAVIRRALEESKVDPKSVTYVEAHGTGTALGDPIEIAGLAGAFGAGAERCAIGSVKSNIGHAESAAGIAGLTKILLQLQHNELVPSLHADELNPHIDFGSTPFVVQRELSPWVGNGTPRRAGLSSFGAGGSNAHLVIEEYVAEPARPVEAPGLIVLSAKDDVRLRESSANLMEHLRGAQVTLTDLAYTLQVGREAMATRLAFHADSVQDVCDQLAQFLDGQDGDFHLGHVGRERTGLAAFAADEDLAETVRQWVRRGKYGHVLQLWTQGLDIDWTALYAGGQPRRLSLPTYPFARDRHWIDQPAPQAGATRLHPLAQRNTSDFTAQRYSATLTGTEFFLADHVVADQPMLPAVCTLELARAAVDLTVPDDVAGLSDVSWLRPFVPAPGVDLHISLIPHDTHIEFEVYSDESTVHAQGKVIPGVATEAVTHDLDAVRAGFKGIPVEHCYAALAGRGIQYGPAMRGLAAVYASNDQVVARLQATTDSAFALHPGLLDAALHAGIALDLDGRRPTVPFAVDSVDILRPCPADAWVWLRRGPDGQSFDVDLCDYQGRLCVRLTGVAVRPLEASSETVLLTPEWTPGADEAGYDHEVLVRVDASAEPVDTRLTALTTDLVTRVRQALRDHADGRILVRVVVPRSTEGQLLSAVSGLLDTAHQEQPRLTGQVVEVDADVPELPVKLPNSSRIRVTAAGTLVAGWREVPVTQAESPWRPDGVYLIAGGGGALGQVLAREIRGKAITATVILAGRSPVDELPDGVVYRQADITDAAAIEALVAEFGRIDGVINAAGVLRDGLLATKSADDIAAVLAPKVAGALALDVATQGQQLDFFVLFASAAGALGNVGQADYATANAFLDRFAEHRSALVDRGERYGKTVAIDWPLWAEGGMRPDDSALSAMREAGMEPLPTAAAMAVLEQAITGEPSQLLVLHGDAIRLRQVPAVTPQESQPVAAPEHSRVVRYMTSVLAAAVKLPAHEIAPDVPLEAYGIDSIMALQMIRELERTFGPLSKTLLFEYRSIDALAHHFTTAHATRLSEVLGNGSVARPVTTGFARTRPTPARPAAVDSGDIAIVGLAGKYPGAQTLDEFWANLRSGVDRWDPLESTCRHASLSIL